MPPLPQTIEEKINAAHTLKEQGNEYFKAGLYKEALKSYTKVFAYTRGLPGATFDSKRDTSSGFDASNFIPQGAARITETQQQRCIDLELAVENNIATVYVKLKNGPKAIIHSNRALERCATNWKAFLRLAEGKALSKDWDGALRALQSASAFCDEKNKRNIAQEIERVKVMQKRESNETEAALRKTLAGAFEKF
jgi:tetratricopeptide (TPR) repeat protein